MTHLLKEGKVSSNITYASQAQNVTVRMCMTPLVKLGIVSSNITYASKAQNVTVRVCLTPLVKVGIDTYSPQYIMIKCHHSLTQDCNLPGPSVCRTEYISECWTKNDPHIVEDDVPKCRTEYEEKCVEKQVMKILNTILVVVMIQYYRLAM